MTRLTELPRRFVPEGTPMDERWNEPKPARGTHGLGWAVEQGDPTPSVVPGYCWCGTWAEDCAGLRDAMASGRYEPTAETPTTKESSE